MTYGESIKTSGAFSAKALCKGCRAVVGIFLEKTTGGACPATLGVLSEEVASGACRRVPDVLPEVAIDKASARFSELTNRASCGVCCDALAVFLDGEVTTSA